MSELVKQFGALLRAIVVIVVGVFILFSYVNCSSSGGRTDNAAPNVTATVDKPSDARVAAAAEQYVTDNLGDLSASSWGRYIAGYGYGNGVLTVRLRVDRTSPDGRAVGELAAAAIARFIRLGEPPAILASVRWVEAIDGTGGFIAQEQVSR